MNPLKVTRLFVMTVGLSLFFIALTIFLVPRATVQALDNVSVYYVAPSCAGVPTPCFTSIQAAVDAVDAPSDVIKVAAGTYTDLHARPRNDISMTGVVTQIVYINKTLTIQGGYTPANWNTPNPEINLTTLDAQGKGRVIYITGDVSTTLAGLRLTGGNSTGLGGRSGGYDGGGGLYVISATVTLSNNEVFSNTAFSGGGLWSYQSSNHLVNNLIHSNNASYCGGLRLYYATGQIDHNVITSNTATSGGGVCLANSDRITVAANTIADNLTSSDSAGLLLSSTVATLMNNIIVSNIVDDSSFSGGQFGGGLSAYSSTVTLHANTVLSNTAEWGGGLFLNGSNVTLTENTLAGNIGRYGGGLASQHSTLFLQHNAVLSNTVDSNGGGGLYFSDSAVALIENHISGNVTSGGDLGFGGGVFMDSSAASIIRNTISGNRGNYRGGGLYLFDSNVILESNFIAQNSSAYDGGGLYVGGYRLATILRHNLIISNSAGLFGGGIFIGGGRLMSTDDRIISNSATFGGGGIHAFPWAPDGEVTLTNTLIAGNFAQEGGAGLHIYSTIFHLFNATLTNNASNTSNPAIALVCDRFGESCPDAHLDATNTIIANTAIGISVTVGSTATLEATLWYSNTQDWAGPGTIITGTHNYWGDPLFVNPEAGDYHIGPGSAAIDRGVPTSVVTDIDNQPRFGIPDLGADEYWAPGALKQILLPILIKN